MILPAVFRKQRVMADFGECRKRDYARTTSARIWFRAGGHVYPRVPRVITIRTPSYGGQSAFSNARLPALLHGQSANAPGCLAKFRSTKNNPALLSVGDDKRIAHRTGGVENPSPKFQRRTANVQ